MKHDTRRLVAFLLILVGASLLSGVVSLATVIVDTSPPSRSASTPSSSQVIGGSLTTISIALTDAAGVGSVYYQDDITAKTGLTRTVGGDTGGTWTKVLVTPVTTYGPHAFTFTFTDQLGNSGTYTGSYTVYTQLTGTWWINDKVVTATSTIISASKTITVSFIKSAGAADATITCTLKITAGGTGTYTLPHTIDNTWMGSYTFPGDGTYTVELKASDGVGTPVTMSIIQIGDAPPFTGLTTSQLIGAMLSAVGVVLVLWRKP